jgi:hypothetical protein
MDYHHITANTTSDMISNMNGDILFADHHHGSTYLTTPQMHRVSSNETLTTSPLIESELESYKNCVSIVSKFVFAV